MRRERAGAMWTGLALVGLGAALLVANWIGWDRIWPIFPILGGLAFWGGYLGSGMRDGGLAFLGTAGILVGIFLFGFTLGYWEWAQIAELWPVFALIGGVAFLVSFLAERRRRDWGALGVGLVGLLVGAVGLAYTQGYVERDISRYWPLLIVLVGVVMLVGALAGASRRK